MNQQQQATLSKREQARRYLRLFLRDTPHLNRLIREEESTDEDLDLALMLAVDDYNITSPPLGNRTIENFPSLWLLLHGGAVNVLKSAGIMQSRNELNYSSGGVTVRTFDKTQLYQSWISAFIAEYERKKVNFKISANIAGALGGGGVSSEYKTIAWFW